ncbi:hypothetical protein CLH39_11995 [Alcaligenes faecalis]|uniref:hypothetical protein n=1 Tax=Alcaligenes faecalis TaxID=511 RepID=UPI0019328EA3|nr:hypothetical protein [Alcaligenes faecalis]QRF90910.1 hypothetical protein CLH39_11995 [Alcaligenes faecalis]
MKRTVFVAAGMVVAGLLSACGEQKDSASNQASEADLHAVTGQLATMAANENANACFQKNRLALKGYESKQAGVDMNKLLAMLPDDPDGEGNEMIKLGYRISGPADDVLNDRFIQCLESGAAGK